MANDDFERISALTDGELSGAELKHALDALGDPELRGRWTRYHLVSDVLHKNFVGTSPKDLPERVATELAQAPPLKLRAIRTIHLPSALWQQAAGVAIAASITAVAILGFQSLQQHPSYTTGTAALVAEQETVENGHSTTPNFDSYLVNHNEVAESSGIQGIPPYVRLVGHK